VQHRNLTKTNENSGLAPDKIFSKNKKNIFLCHQEFPVAASIVGAANQGNFYDTRFFSSPNDYNSIGAEPPELTILIIAPNAKLWRNTGG
jgi:hypothetical protein